MERCRVGDWKLGGALWCNEAVAGRFRKELLLFYVAGIPTYVVMGELATGVLLAGSLPKLSYPEVLRQEAFRRWHDDAVASLGYAAAAALRVDPTLRSDWRTQAVH